MKARYFPGKDFLHATLGENPSYMWRSILAAQNVVKQGCRKSIGTGMDTSVWSMPWLPSIDNGYLTTPMYPELNDIKVCDLMDIQDKKWDDAILHDLFNDRDIQLIQNIPLSSRITMDTWIWLPDEKGEFTVRSCYRSLVGECNTPDATFWKKLWKLELPGKIQFFLWRTARFCLPTNTALIEKKVNVDSACSWCRVHAKTAKHVLFECQFAKEVWTSSGMAQWTQSLPAETILEQFKRLFNSGSMEQCTLLAVLCWSIWNRRNKWVWSRIADSVFGITSAAMNLLVNWKTTQRERNRCSSLPVKSGVQRWQVPQRNWVKINIDAAVFMDLRAIGIGGIVRDERGSFLRAMCKQKEGVWSPREA